MRSSALQAHGMRVVTSHQMLEGNYTHSQVRHQLETFSIEMHRIVQFYQQVSILADDSAHESRKNAQLFVSERPSVGLGYCNYCEAAWRVHPRTSAQLSKH